MKRLAWVTDIHLNFLQDSKVEHFCRSVADLSPDAVLIGGDISDASGLKSHLKIIERCLECPVYFVLGNHDFYGASIEVVRSVVQTLAEEYKRLNWLPASGLVELTENTGLIGHDGWPDGRLGQGERSQVLLNDYFYIKEFKYLSHRDRFRMLNRLGDEVAEYFMDLLPAAAERFENLLLLTHVPPYRESCWHEGIVSDDAHLPHFACQAVGEVITDVMQNFPERKLTVLCGHTHGRGEVQIASNIFVKTGEARYRRPQVQDLIVVD